MTSLRSQALLMAWATTACSLASAQTLASGPFAGVDLAALPASDREVVAQANEDFELVRSGKKPAHAQVDPSAALPRDGGTSYYVGKHYRLKIVKSLSSFGSLRGYVYGPVISFDRSFAPGNEATVSGTRFLTFKQLSELTSR